MKKIFAVAVAYLFVLVLVVGAQAAGQKLILATGGTAGT